jgi:membrane protein implicated in regulation of membrane protease activity
MDLVSLLVMLIIVGAVLYIVSLLPIDPTIKKVIQVVAIVAIAIWVLREFVPSLGLHHVGSNQTIAETYKLAA